MISRAHRNWPTPPHQPIAMHALPTQRGLVDSSDGAIPRARHRESWRFRGGSDPPAPSTPNMTPTRDPHTPERGASQKGRLRPPRHLFEALGTMWGGGGGVGQLSPGAGASPAGVFMELRDRVRDRRAETQTRAAAHPAILRYRGAHGHLARSNCVIFPICVAHMLRTCRQCAAQATPTCRAHVPRTPMVGLPGLHQVLPNVAPLSPLVARF